MTRALKPLDPAATVRRHAQIPRVAVDAMGGDLGPAPIVEGALLAAHAGVADVTLVGDVAAIEAELRRAPRSASRTHARRASRDSAAGRGPRVPGEVTVAPAGSVVGADEAPLLALRRKPDCSVRVTFDRVASGEADAGVSAGHTGAAFAAATLILGRLPGVERPAIAATMPTLTGQVVLLDVGANERCRPAHLVTFAAMGAAYARAVLGVAHPRVAILSNGTEATKGTDLTREAHALLRHAIHATADTDLTFAGYVEGRELFAGRVDVIVTDGFVGNIVLKTAEGAAAGFGELIRQAIGRDPLGVAGALLLRRALRRIRTRTDWAERGAAPLLGVRRPALVAHGASDARAIANAIRAAAAHAAADLSAAVAQAVQRLLPNGPSEAGAHAKRRLAASESDAPDTEDPA